MSSKLHIWLYHGGDWVETHSLPLTGIYEGNYIYYIIIGVRKIFLLNDFFINETPYHYKPWRNLLMYTPAWTGFVTILQSEQFKKRKIHTEAPNPKPKPYRYKPKLHKNVWTYLTNESSQNISGIFLCIHASYFLSFKRN